MRYSSALVLSTLAIGQAAAGSVRHASFHARRSAAKRDNSAVDWSKVSYDLSSVDWSTVDFGNGKPSPSPTPSPVVAAAEEKESSSATPTPTPEPTPSPEPSPSQAEEPKKSSAAPKPSKSASGGGVLTSGAELKKAVEGIGAYVGSNPTSNNGKIWLGDDSDWTMTFTNKKGQDMLLFCWEAKGYSGMIMSDANDTPWVSILIPTGESQTVAFGLAVSGGCAPAKLSDKLAFFGAIDNTWLEFTTGRGPLGAFDVSREVNMSGDSISAVGSVCTSDMDTCVFKCKNGNSCEASGTYYLSNCEGSGGMTGTASDGGASGGCQMGTGKEHIEVALF
ncbi:hypothetical protein P154DRAFT_474478 [Amniculicola lignicola CBS 123094]|uniref:Uncharacterized protein n=1 Tax=Amniculicola lignicola CBS 123094 TaxID=1392246 RepID=A0A6A5WCK5_9PLEO|nr:hypothetical protein P154DRAFT_474478 [Amniculicola lignicola CBS 123094]